MSEYQEYRWESGATHAHGFLYPTLARLLKGRKDRVILDIGCGNGEMTNRLIKDGYNVYGIDASISGIEVANKSNPGRFFTQNVNSKLLPKEIRDIEFDLIISTEVIEHLYDPRGYVEFCRNILLPSKEGEMIISTPYHGYLKNIVLAISGKMDSHFTALWDGGHIKFWSVKTITTLLREFDFKVVEFKGSGRVPYLWKSMFVRAKLE